ncbi:MAG: DedA family protein [Dehalobacterium sp.]|jgi:membrane protein DedA with SNARE-associated domain
MAIWDFEFARIVPFISQFGYAGAAGALFMEGLSIPFPGGTFLLIYGFLASQGQMSLPLAILIASIGYTAATTFPYCIGKIGGRPLVLNYGPYFGLSHKNFNITERWFKKFGAFFVAFGRLMFFRNYVSYFAGIAKMPTLRFYLFTWIGITPWVAFMTILGYVLGNNWSYALTLLERYSWIGVLILLGAGIIMYFLLKSRLLKRFNKWLGDA